LKVESYVGSKNKMVFDSPKVLAWAKPGRGGWVKKNLRCDGLLPFGCRWGSNRLGKTMRAGDGAAWSHFSNSQENERSQADRTGQTLFLRRSELYLLSFKRGKSYTTRKTPHFFKVTPSVLDLQNLTLSSGAQQVIPSTSPCLNSATDEPNFLIK
jgi:hypothetical protein